VLEYAIFVKPSGSEAVLIVRPGETVSASVLLTDCCVGAVESVTVSLTLLDPVVVGVPEITPLVALLARPAGRPVADHE